MLDYACGFLLYQETVHHGYQSTVVWEKLVVGNIHEKISW